MMRVVVDRETLALDLRTYGEDRLAQRVAALDDQTLARVHRRAADHLYNGDGRLLAKAVTLAAIEILEGAPRQPRWTRRKLKGIWPDQASTDSTDDDGPGKDDAPPLSTREVERAIASAMDAAGYTRAPGEARVFLKPLAEGVDGWVSYFVNRKAGAAPEVTPNVGVRHRRIHELVGRLTAVEQPASMPTATIILGYLAPERTANMVWRFDRETPAGEAASGMVDYVVRYGEPWMQARVPLAAIIEQVRWDQRGVNALHRELLPVALLLTGHTDEARTALDVELAKLGERTDAAAEAFRQFADRFEAAVEAVVEAPPG